MAGIITSLLLVWLQDGVKLLKWFLCVPMVRSGQALTLCLKKKGIYTHFPRQRDQNHSAKACFSLTEAPIKGKLFFSHTLIFMPAGMVSFADTKQQFYKRA